MEAMRKEQDMKNLMRHYYKTGNMEESAKLQKLFETKTNKKPEVLMNFGEDDEVD